MVPDVVPCHWRKGGPILLAGDIEFVAARTRYNTVVATASDLRTPFAIVEREPLDVTTADVQGFMTIQRKPRGDGRVVRLADGE